MLKSYFVYIPIGSFCEPDPAVLVFARYSTEAKKIAYRECEWCREFNYIELRVRLIREDTDYWLSFADKEKLEKEIPHIASKEPPYCESCGAYLSPDGTCPLCKECEEAAL